MELSIARNWTLNYTTFRREKQRDGLELNFKIRSGTRLVPHF